MSSASTGTVSDLKPMDLRESIGGLVSQTRMALFAALDEELKSDAAVAALEVTTAQFVVIAYVLKKNVNSACTLCEQLDYDRGAMSRMIDRLESKGLIRRVPLPHTRRGFALEVTPAGRAAFPKMEACAQRVMTRLLRGLTKAQLREAEKVLRQMLANAGAASSGLTHTGSAG
jgi:DNA-binding MarR family transcriptional regulator